MPSSASRCTSCRRRERKSPDDRLFSGHRRRPRLRGAGDRPRSIRVADPPPRRVRAAAPDVLPLRGASFARAREPRGAGLDGDVLRRSGGILRPLALHRARRPRGRGARGTRRCGRARARRAQPGRVLRPPSLLGGRLILMVRGVDLLVVFLGLELMSLALYVLAAWYRDVPAATEAALKYFLMRAFASAFLLYGVATVYGRLGTTRLTRLQGLASGHSLVPFDVLLGAGLLAIVAALSFKIALVPFHGWAPDVYQGMTTPAVTFLSTAPKVGALLVLFRILHALFPSSLPEPWRPLFAIIAVLSILFGNVVALSHRDLKRMLAYSGIAQMGYASIAVATLTREAFEGVLVFLAGYVVTNAAAFLAVAALSAGAKEPHPLGDLAGLGRRHPVAASALTLSMLSLAGLPPTVGSVSYTHLRAHETVLDLVCRLLL